MISRMTGKFSRKTFSGDRLSGGGGVSMGKGTENPLSGFVWTADSHEFPPVDISSREIGCLKDPFYVYMFAYIDFQYR